MSGGLCCTKNLIKTTVSLGKTPHVKTESIKISVDLWEMLLTLTISRKEILQLNSVLSKRKRVFIWLFLIWLILITRDQSSDQSKKSCSGWETAPSLLQPSRFSHPPWPWMYSRMAVLPLIIFVMGLTTCLATSGAMRATCSKSFTDTARKALS